jgi:hypothetical protein
MYEMKPSTQSEEMKSDSESAVIATIGSSPHGNSSPSFEFSSNLVFSPVQPDVEQIETFDCDTNVDGDNQMSISAFCQFVSFSSSPKPNPKPRIISNAHNHMNAQFTYSVVDLDFILGPYNGNNNVDSMGRSSEKKQVLALAEPLDYDDGLTTDESAVQSRSNSNQSESFLGMIQDDSNGYSKDLKSLSGNAHCSLCHCVSFLHVGMTSYDILSAANGVSFDAPRYRSQSQVSVSSAQATCSETFKKNVRRSSSVTETLSRSRHGSLSTFENKKCRMTTEYDYHSNTSSCKPNEIVDEDEIPQKYEVILPEPGFVIKSKRETDGIKIFINIFHHGVVEDIMATMAKDSVDKSGVACQTYDVLVPEQVFEELTKDEYYCDMVCFPFFLAELIEAYGRKENAYEFSLRPSARHDKMAFTMKLIDLWVDLDMFGSD